MGIEIRRNGFSRKNNKEFLLDIEDFKKAATKNFHVTSACLTDIYYAIEQLLVKVERLNLEVFSSHE